MWVWVGADTLRGLRREAWTAGLQTMAVPRVSESCVLLGRVAERAPRIRLCAREPGTAHSDPPRSCLCLLSDRLHPCPADPWSQVSGPLLPQVPELSPPQAPEHLASVEPPFPLPALFLASLAPPLKEASQPQLGVLPSPRVTVFCPPCQESPLWVATVPSSRVSLPSPPPKFRSVFTCYRFGREQWSGQEESSAVCIPGVFEHTGNPHVWKNVFLVFQLQMELKSSEPTLGICLKL